MKKIIYNFMICAFFVFLFCNISYGINYEYQENSDSHSFEIIFTGGLHDFMNGILYLNYSKPENSTGALWMINYGWNITINNFIITNITIPHDCFNYLNDKITLRFISCGHFINGHYCYNQCYNGTNWKTIGEISNTTINYGGQFDFHLNKSIDGIWNKTLINHSFLPLTYDSISGDFFALDIHNSWMSQINNNTNISQNRKMFASLQEEAIYWIMPDIEPPPPDYSFAFLDLREHNSILILGIIVLCYLVLLCLGFLLKNIILGSFAVFLGITIGIILFQIHWILAFLFILKNIVIWIYLPK